MPQVREGKLYIVGTPIGNLGDITQRAIDALNVADTICAEDTRVTGKLLHALDIDAHVERCDENVIAARAAHLIDRMRAGEVIAFCSDAGMPGVSDPGLVLVDAAHDAHVPVEVLPGASAVTTALVAAGFNGTAFYFGGFMPRKQAARAKLLQQLKALDAALVFYESPHRVTSSVQSIAAEYGSRPVAMCRELTKLHEEVLRLPADQLADNLAARDVIKGEIALVIAPPSDEDLAIDLEDEDIQARIERELAAGMSKSALAKQLAKELGISKNEIYSMIHSK